MVVKMIEKTKHGPTTIDPLSNAHDDVLIQVPQRGCCGVCSGRRHPQRKSSIFVVVFLDSASRSVSIRGHGRRCESIGFEKVRTIEPLVVPRNLIKSLHYFLIEQSCCFTVFCLLDVHIRIHIILLLLLLLLLLYYLLAAPLLHTISFIIIFLNK